MKTVTEVKKMKKNDLVISYCRALHREDELQSKVKELKAEKAKLQKAFEGEAAKVAALKKAPQGDQVTIEKVSSNVKGRVNALVTVEKVGGAWNQVLLSWRPGQEAKFRILEYRVSSRSKVAGVLKGLKGKAKPFKKAKGFKKRIMKGSALIKAYKPSQKEGADMGDSINIF